MSSSDSTDIDSFIDKVCERLDSQFDTYDRFAVSSDIKQFIYDKASKLSEAESISLDKAVILVLSELGTPDDFSVVFIKGLKSEKRYLLMKVLVAFFIFLFPIFLIIITLTLN